jgi:hypothetical protein
VKREKRREVEKKRREKNRKQKEKYYLFIFKLKNYKKIPVYTQNRNQQLYIVKFYKLIHN